MDSSNKCWIYHGKIRPMYSSDYSLILKITKKFKKMTKQNPNIDFKNTLYKIDGNYVSFGEVNSIVNLIIEEYLILNKASVNTAFSFFIKKDIIPILFYQENRKELITSYPEPQILLFNKYHQPFNPWHKEDKTKGIYFYPFAHKLNNDTVSIQFTVVEPIRDDGKYSFRYINDLEEIKKLFPDDIEIHDQGKNSNKKLILVKLELFKNDCLVCSQIERLLDLQIFLAIPHNRVIDLFEDLDRGDGLGLGSVGYGSSEGVLPKAPILKNIPEISDPCSLIELK